MARRLRRGDVHLIEFAGPDKQRPAVLLTRDHSLERLSTVTVAPITSTIRNAASQVILTIDDGLKQDCAVNLHNLTTLSQERVGKRVASLSQKRMAEIASAIQFALGCD